MKLLIIQNDGISTNDVTQALEYTDYPFITFPDPVTFYQHVKQSAEPFILVSEIVTSLETEFEIISNLLAMSHFHGLLIISKHAEDIVHSVKCYLHEQNFTNVLSIPETHPLDKITHKINLLIRNIAKPNPIPNESYPAGSLPINDMLTEAFIFPFYQPKVRSRDEEIVGYEVLSRLDIGGTIYPPSDFIPHLTNEEKITDFTYTLISKAINEISQIENFHGSLSFNVDYQSLSKQEFAANVGFVA